jgi:hypothetical protein
MPAWPKVLKNRCQWAWTASLPTDQLIIYYDDLSPAEDSEPFMEF